VTTRRIGEVAGAQGFLDVDRAAHCFHRAGKFGQHGVARRVEDAAAIARDEIVGHLTVGGETPQRLFFILGNQSAVTGNVGCEYRRDLAFHDSPGSVRYARACRERLVGATRKGCAVTSCQCLYENSENPAAARRRKRLSASPSY
jgi:hypothetical protein